MYRSPARLSITSVFTLATLVPLVLLGVLLLLMSVQTVDESSAALGKDILQESALRVDDDVRRYLDYTRRMSDLLAGLVREKLVTAGDTEEWTKRLFVRLRVTPEVSSICYTNESLDTIYLMRYPPDLEYGVGIGHKDGSTMSVFEAHSDGTISPESRRTYEYDPRTRPWWTLGYETDEPVWTQPYEWFSTPERSKESKLAIAYTRTVRDQAGQRLGVLSIDATLDQINQHLSEVIKTHGAFIVLTDDQDRVVCSSLAGKLTNLVPVANLVASQNEAERRVAELFGKIDGHRNRTLDVELNGNQYWVRQVPLSIDRGPKWTMTLAVPDDQLLQGAKSAIEWIKIVGTIYVSAAAIFAVLLARMVSKPFRRLAAFAREIGGGRFSQRVEPATTREFDELSHALNAMAANLQERVHLMAQRNAAEEASSLKARLIAHVSHEFRTPLNAIIGYSEMLKESSDAEGRDRASRDVGNILLASRHLLTLINNLLDLSRIDAGKMRLDVARFNVSSLVKEVELTIRPVVEKNDNHFVASCDLEDENMVSDPARIKQVLINFLGNAGKFTTNGRITLSVAAVGDQDVQFCVTDTGPGMTSEQREKLFVPFAEVHLPNELSGVGAGLGLAISKQLCDLLGGKLDVSSEVNVGTRVCVTLPRIYRSQTAFQIA